MLTYADVWFFSGTLFFTYTAHGEQFFDYLLFTVDNMRVHDTQSWWSTGIY
jgi:hypothetical protein